MLSFAAETSMDKSQREDCPHSDERRVKLQKKSTAVNPSAPNQKMEFIHIVILLF
jgi:hypothetical protein